MNAWEVSSPFGDDELEQVALANAPLVSVVAQVRFRGLSAFAGSESPAATGLIAALADRYPYCQVQQERSVTIGPDGVTEQDAGNLWKLSSADGHDHVTFGDSFLAVDSTAYASRSALCDELQDALTHLAAVTGLRQVDRIGYRYINQIVDDAVLEKLPQLVKPALLGFLNVPQLEAIKLDMNLNQAAFSISDTVGLQARWGILPPNVVVDPTIAPTTTRSWVLDIDTFRLGPLNADPVSLRAQAEEIAARAYRFFRWSVTSEFLVQFGGVA